MTVEEIIKQLNLKPLPEEGGFFRRTYESSEKIPGGTLPRQYPQDLFAGTAIYALFTPTEFSAMHRLDTDEIYHFYYGDPLEVLLLHPNGSGETFTLGNDFQAGMVPQKVVKKNVWQGSRSQPGGQHGFSLIGTTMAPGFEWEGFELGNSKLLSIQYPAFSEKIASLTR
ncbi:MAG: cupin domain-containing protein [Chloroflexi bacterium]|nr:MAG: cupin domain-containing protein [Chloroflexota bacterium]